MGLVRMLHHSQTIHLRENFISLILFKIPYQLIFDLAAIEAQNTTACTVRLKKAGKS